MLFERGNFEVSHDADWRNFQAKADGLRSGAEETAPRSGEGPTSLERGVLGVSACRAKYLGSTVKRRQIVACLTPP